MAIDSTQWLPQCFLFDMQCGVSTVEGCPKYKVRPSDRGTPEQGYDFEHTAMSRNNVWSILQRTLRACSNCSFGSSSLVVEVTESERVAVYIHMLTLPLW
jgi:hypothetical protein